MALVEKPGTGDRTAKPEEVSMMVGLAGASSSDAVRSLRK